MSIDLVHDDVEKSLIKVTLKQRCIAVSVTSGANLGVVNHFLLTCTATRKWKSSSRVRKG